MLGKIFFQFDKLHKSRAFICEPAQKPSDFFPHAAADAQIAAPHGKQHAHPPWIRQCVGDGNEFKRIYISPTDEMTMAQPHEPRKRFFGSKLLFGGMPGCAR
jgi:hypothetical protein